MCSRDVCSNIHQGVILRDEFASLATLWEQYVKQYRQNMVSLKRICQSWGLNISNGISGEALLREMIENPEELREGLLNMAKQGLEMKKALIGIKKTLERVSKGDELCKVV